MRWVLRFVALIREDLKSLTICGFNYKGSTSSHETLSVGPNGVELRTSPTVVGYQHVYLMYIFANLLGIAYII